MKAMVLAAGVGSRLDPLTSQVPKPLVPVANRPVMEHILRLLKRHDCPDIVSNLHYMPDQIREYFGDGKKLGVNLTFHEEKELSGDAGGVRACRSFFDQGTFLVLMGDLLTDADLSEVVRQHKAKKALATIGIKQVDDVRHFGVVVTDENGFITGFQEKPQPEEALSNYASTGIYVLEPEVFNHIPESGTYGFGRQLFPSLVEQGLPVLGVSIDGSYWSDVGTIAQYRVSNFDAVRREVEVEMLGTPTPWGFQEKGASVASGVDLQGMLYLGQNSKISPNVRIRGTVVVGDGCVVEEGAQLENTVIWSDTTVGAGTVLTDCVIGAKCRVDGGGSHKEVASVNWTKQLTML